MHCLPHTEQGMSAEHVWKNTHSTPYVPRQQAVSPVLNLLLIMLLKIHFCNILLVSACSSSASGSSVCIFHPFHNLT